MKKSDFLKLSDPDKLEKFFQAYERNLKEKKELEAALDEALKRIEELESDNFDLQWENMRLNSLL